MNDNEFKNYVINKLNEIEHRLTRVETMLNDYHKFIKLLYFIIASILGLLGINIHNII